MEEVELVQTTGPFQDAGPSAINLGPTMLLRPGDFLTPTPNPYVDQSTVTRVDTEFETHERTTEL